MVELRWISSKMFLGLAMIFHIPKLAACHNASQTSKIMAIPRKLAKANSSDQCQVKMFHFSIATAQEGKSGSLGKVVAVECLQLLLACQWLFILLEVIDLLLGRILEGQATVGWLG